MKNALILSSLLLSTSGQALVLPMPITYYLGIDSAEINSVKDKAYKCLKLSEQPQKKKCLLSEGFIKESEKSYSMNTLNNYKVTLPDISGKMMHITPLEINPFFSAGKKLSK